MRDGNISFLFSGESVRIQVYPETGIHYYCINVPADQLRSLGCDASGAYQFEGAFTPLGAEGAGAPITLICDGFSVGHLRFRLIIDTSHLADEPAIFLLAPVFNRKAAAGRQAGTRVEEVTLCQVQVVCGKPIQSALVVDLGNTRTFALVVDNIQANNQAGGEITITPLRLIPHRRNGIEEEGVFDSLTALQNPDDEPTNPGGVPPPLQPLSFVRLGREAGGIHGLIYRSEEGGGRYSLSSPKRYFWEDDNEASGWKAMRCVSRLSDVVGAAQLAGPLPAQLSTPALNAQNIPRSGILMGMVAELFEQAERHLNSWKYQNEQFIKGPRRIGRICILYPATWTHGQLEMYRKKITSGIGSYCELRRMQPPEVDITCDESTAVLLPYVYGEVIKSGAVGENWVQSVGRRARLPNGELDDAVARIAVIDIGGGTTDLVICDLKDVEKGVGVELVVRRVYQDGINKAGDEFLRVVAERIAVPLVANSIIPSPDPAAQSVRQRAFGALLTEQRSGKAGHERAHLARSLWFPLAIAIVQNLAHNLDFVDISAGPIKSFLGLIYQEVKKWATENMPAESKFVNSLEESLQLPFGAQKTNFQKRLSEIANTMFAGPARAFGAAIGSFECDLVLFAGKASEIEVLRRVFEQSLPVPGDRCVMLRDYAMPLDVLGGIKIFGVGQAGRIADAKVTTVLGAALYTISRANAAALGTPMQVDVSQSAAGLEESQHWWGVIGPNAVKFSNDSALFGPHKDLAEVRYRGPMVIGRRRFGAESQEGDAVYQLRIKPSVVNARGQPTGAVTLELNRVVGRNGNVSVVVSRSTGQYADRSPVERGHFEVRHCILLREHWLDTGLLNTDELHQGA